MIQVTYKKNVLALVTVFIKKMFQTFKVVRSLTYIRIIGTTQNPLSLED